MGSVSIVVEDGTGSNISDTRAAPAPDERGVNAASSRSRSSKVLSPAARATSSLTSGSVGGGEWPDFSRFEEGSKGAMNDGGGVEDREEPEYVSESPEG